MDRMEEILRTNLQDWTYVTPDFTNPVKIRIFDDGNTKYNQYENSWFIFGRWDGKVALFNEFDQNITIMSISEWKVYSTTI
jgi:hypothetical protein